MNRRKLCHLALRSTKAEGLLFQQVAILLLLAITCVSAMHPQAERLIGKRMMSESNVGVPPGFEIYFYTQTLDHFNYNPESYNTFQQRYIINSKYWGGANTSSPIFLYTGDEGNIIFEASSGFHFDLASRFKGLLLFIEHRYYGDSNPFGSKTEAFKNASTLGYLNSAQALADYAQLMTDLKKNLSAENSPVIAFGGSYGGMLSAWFRLKYPHITIGALASSAPILYFDDITPQNGYHVVVTRDFKETSESCYNTVRQSWPEIDKAAAQPNGLANLTRIFSTCRPLNSSEELKDYLGSRYVLAAQYDNPPRNLVSKICSAIDISPGGAHILGKVAAGLNVSIGIPCDLLLGFKPSNYSAWTWQTCTEMVMPIGYGANETMFPAAPFDIKNYTKMCQNLFGITPMLRPHWITTEFGGHHIKSVLSTFASNIIFSNGLRDPYSVGGVLNDISDSVVAVYTEKGAHCLDLQAPMPSDPDWLIAQREKEIKIVDAWIADYMAKLAT